MNHFIECGVSEISGLWITIHSGSRNLGKKVCDYHQQIAVQLQHLGAKFDYKSKIDQIVKEAPKDKRQKLIEEVRKQQKQIELIKGDGLDFLTGQHCIDYLVDMMFCQEYASLNRRMMMKQIFKVIKGCFHLDINPLEEIETVHNYINFDDLIIRKGAIASYKGQKMIIPFNMEDGILICEGKSNPEWNFSSPHGAGRVGSRAWAKKNLNLEEAKKSMEDKGIFSSLIPLDECRLAYKDSKLIEEAIEPTATILDRIKPIMNLKAED